MKKVLNRLQDLKKRILSLPPRAQEACLWHMENLSEIGSRGPAFDKACDAFYDVLTTSYLKKAHLTGRSTKTPDVAYTFFEARTKSDYKKADEESVQTTNIRYKIADEVNAFESLNLAQMKKMVRFFYSGKKKRSREVFAKDIIVRAQFERN